MRAKIVDIGLNLRHARLRHLERADAYIHASVSYVLNPRDACLPIRVAARQVQESLDVILSNPFADTSRRGTRRRFRRTAPGSRLRAAP